MPKLKNIPKVFRPREKLMEKGPDNLSKVELLANLLGSGIKGKNVKAVAEQIIKRHNQDFLELTVDKLTEISGIGNAKASQIISAIALIKRFYKEQNSPYLLKDGIQYSLFDLYETESSKYYPPTIKNHKVYFSHNKRNIPGIFQMQNRRFLGNKYKLLGFIEDIVNEKCNGFESFCDIFSGTGVVGERFNEKDIKIISNDILFSNYYPLKTFLGTTQLDINALKNKIDLLNNLTPNQDNYFSENYGNTFFSLENARKIGVIRNIIDNIADNECEKAALITSLIYATDKVANTVGHYDAYRKKLDSVQPIKLLIPKIDLENNHNNQIYQKDANLLIREIYCDVLYVDPPYNSRQYCDAYHLLENLATWKKPEVFGKAKKMDRTSLKSEYCLKTATKAFRDLITNANCKHILISYNNTGESKHGRSNARIKDKEIIEILKSKGKVEIFERDYKAFTTGKSNTTGHTERVFYCKTK